MPSSPWVMTQSWHDLLFAHWPLEPQQLRDRIPRAFTLDLFDGRAWIGIVPFHMSNVAPRLMPALPRLSAFPELNVRTYVRADDRPGVYFFSLDAGSAVAVRVARALLNLPYFAADMRVTPAGDRIDYVSRRRLDGSAQLVASYSPIGPAFAAERDSLDYFLTERYCLYHVSRRGAPYRLDIHHPPWPLQRAAAKIERNTMAAVHGFTLPAEEPLLHFSKRQDMVAWPPTYLG